MGSSASVPRKGPVAAGKTRVCIAGFPISHNVGLSVKTADEIAKVHPDKYETWYYYGYSSTFRDFIDTEVKPTLSPEQQEHFKAHRTAPFCWIEKDDGTVHAYGPGDRFREWVASEFAADDDASIKELATRPPSLLGDLFFNKSTATTTVITDEVPHK
eukprot:TRINITY_DN10927_c0_g1_i1.p1 TRINITY_DN10927_c0_g1~~TRINITY_DN10927_c0_g1_i1.p1  ORF type:complete len:158 (+),score=25.37 TRINITY_DN10927_c0_g1_i1:30-503(+)